MSFTLYLLATHPEIQRKCWEELNDVVDGDQDRAATSEDLARMKKMLEGSGIRNQESGTW